MSRAVSVEELRPYPILAPWSTVHLRCSIMIGESTQQARERDEQLSTLLGSTLETIIHQLCYQRIIYPADSFVLHRHLGVRCFASRVPQVSQYISSFLEVAVPSVIRGFCSSIVFFVLEEEVVASNNSRGVGERTGGTEVVERFVFEFDVDQVVGTVEHEEKIKGQQDEMDIEDLQKQSADKKDSELVVEARSQLERSLKECLLRCIALRKRRRRAKERQENMSFKLSMRTKVESAAKDCSELTNALKEGDFLIPASNSCNFSKGGSLRPIKQIDLTSSCGMRMNFGMEIESS